jgi:hypothetical protein
MIRLVDSCGRKSEMGPVIATVNTGALIFRIFLLCYSPTLRITNPELEPLYYNHEKFAMECLT